MRKVVIALLFALTFTAVSAQDAQPTAFMRAMALVSFSEFFTDAPVFLSYADYHSGLAARGLEVPADWAALEASENPSHVLLALPAAGPNGILRNLVRGGGEYETILGFDFFDIAQGVEVGNPPAFGQILIGEIDPAAVVAAYEARNYSAEALNTGILLCPEIGCDTNMATDLANLNPANPFGGNIGRSEPLFVTDGVLLNAPANAVLQAMMDALQQEATTFADLPQVQAVGTVLAEYPFVNAVTLVNPMTFALADPASLFGIGTDPEMIESLLNSMPNGILPPYSLVAVAGTADDAGEYGLLMLTYDQASDAQKAAGVLDARLAVMVSLLTDRPYSEYYGAVGMLEPAQVVNDDATGLSTVIVRLAGGPAPNVDENGQFQQSDTPYSRFSQSLIADDLSWLAWGSSS